MDATSVCDCAFRDRCATFTDRLIEPARKGPEGLGCARQSDHYRNQHCHAFRCQSLCAMFADFLAPGRARQVK